MLPVNGSWKKSIHDYKLSCFIHKGQGNIEKRALQTLYIYSLKYIIWSYLNMNISHILLANIWTSSSHTHNLLPSPFSLHPLPPPPPPPPSPLPLLLPPPPYAFTTSDHFPHTQLVCWLPATPTSFITHEIPTLWLERLRYRRSQIILIDVNVGTRKVCKYIWISKI